MFLKRRLHLFPIIVAIEEEQGYWTIESVTEDEEMLENSDSEEYFLAICKNIHTYMLHYTRNIYVHIFCNSSV